MPETLDDVSAAIDLLDTLPVDRSRVVTIGHSAGGHLAAWAATRETAARGASPASSPRPACWTSQRARGAAALRRRRRPLPRRHRPSQLASPIERLPLGVPALLTHGGRDDIVPVEISERFAEASGASLIVEPDEDHFGHLDPDNPLWKAVLAWL